MTTPGIACESCGGSGVAKADRDLGGSGVTNSSCLTCSGSGKSAVKAVAWLAGVMVACGSTSHNLVEGTAPLPVGKVLYGPFEVDCDLCKGTGSVPKYDLRVDEKHHRLCSTMGACVHEDASINCHGLGYTLVEKRLAGMLLLEARPIIMVDLLSQNVVEDRESLPPLHEAITYAVVDLEVAA